MPAPFYNVFYSTNRKKEQYSSVRNLRNTLNIAVTFFPL